MSLLILKDIKKSFKGKKNNIEVLKGIDLEIEREI